MASLESSYGEWRAAPLPSGNGSEDFGEIHADLVLVDSWVAEYVIPFVERGIKHSPRVDVSGALTDLRRRLSDLDRGPVVSKRALADEYSRYIAMLEELWQSFCARDATGR